MRTVTRISMVGLSAAGMLLVGASGAFAGGAVALTDQTLDRITAGAAVALLSSTAAQAAGVLAITGTSANTVVAPGVSPIAGNPGLGTTIGVTEGAAVAMGTNLSQPGARPASSSTGVATDGVAYGGFVWKSTINSTFRGAGGVTAQAGWTVVYGGWWGL